MLMGFPPSFLFVLLLWCPIFQMVVTALAKSYWLSGFTKSNLIPLVIRDIVTGCE